MSWSFFIFPILFYVLFIFIFGSLTQMYGLSNYMLLYALVIGISLIWIKVRLYG